MKSPYDEDEITAILIDGMNDWVDILPRSFDPVMVPVKYDDDGKVIVELPGIRVIDKFTKDHVFFFAENLKAVRWNPDPDAATINQTEDHRLLP